MLTHSSQALNWWQTQPEAFLFHCLAPSKTTSASIHANLFDFKPFASPGWTSSVTPICESYFVRWGKASLREKHSSSNLLCLGLGFNLNPGVLGWPCTPIRCALWHCAHSRKTRWKKFLKPWTGERLQAWHRNTKKPSRCQGSSFFLLLRVAHSNMALTMKALLASPYTCLDYISHKNGREDHMVSSHTVWLHYSQ